MRTFLRDHWKTIVAIIVLVLLALVTANPGAATVPAPSLAARLHVHAAALASHDCPPAARLNQAAAYIDNALAQAGYTVQAHADASTRAIEAAVANVAPGARPDRSFIVGAHYDGADADEANTHTTSAAAVLELARLLAQVRPTRGTEIRFVFLLGPDRGRTSGAPNADGRNGNGNDGEGGGFIAYAGTPVAARQVQDALAAFQSVAHLGARGLATPAYMQGITLSGNAGGGATLVVTDTTFTRFPYRHGAGDGAAPDGTLDERLYSGVARVVDGLARRLAGLAAGQRG